MAIEVGKKAPAFTLAASDGTQVKLADLAGKIVVLYFYPRDNTPGCTVEAEGFRDARPALEKLGAVVLGASKDSIASHVKFRDKFSLGFELLSDPDGKVLEAYGAWGEKVMYGRKMQGIIRSTVVIDAAGKIAAHWPKVSVKGHVDAVVEAVRQLADPDAAPAKKPTPAKKAAPAKKAPAPAKKPAAKKPAPKRR